VFHSSLQDRTYPILQGDVPVFLGVIFCIFGVLMGKAGATGLGSSLTPWPKPLPDNRLETRGMFKHCRHPTYAGLLLSTFGYALFVGTVLRLVLFALLFIVIDFKTSREEAWLLDRHKEDYEKYCKKIPRYIPLDPHAAIGDAWRSLWGQL